MAEAPRFPSPSRELYEGSAPARAAEFLGRADAWARAAGPWLRGQPTVSAKLKDLVEALLRGETPKGADFRPYGLAGYPRDGAPAERAAAVLRWRARLSSFLSDIWDVMGDPLFELVECQKALEALATASASPARCTGCLLDVPEAERAGHWEHCPARVPPPPRSPHAP